MQERLEKALKTLFGREVARRIPSFVASNVASPDMFLFKCPPVTFFVYLSIPEDKDAFTLEIASNKAEDYPWAEMPGLLKDAELAAEKDVWRFRISTLWGAVREQWWWLGPEPDRTSIINRIRTKPILEMQDLEQKAADIEPKLRDAVEKVCKYAVPFFERSAKQHGNALKIHVSS